MPDERDAKFTTAVLLRYFSGSELVPVMQEMYSVSLEMFKKSRWADRDDEEAEMAKEMMNIPAFYQVLRERFDAGRAKDIVSQMTVPISYWKHWDYFYEISNEGDELEVAKRFVEYANRVGVGKFTEHEVARSDDICIHMKFTGCLYDEVCQEAGMPELTRVFCDADDAFFPAAFPGLDFNRGGSQTNTIGYGCDHCDLILQRRE
jgi:hypothetical protein